MDAKPLRIRFDKVNGLIKIYKGIRYLELSIIHIMKFIMGLILEYIMQCFIGLIIL